MISENTEGFFAKATIQSCHSEGCSSQPEESSLKIDICYVGNLQILVLKK